MYVVLERQTLKVLKREAQSSYVASFMLARRVSDYVIVKVEGTVDKVYNVNSFNGDVITLQKDLEKL